MGLLDVNKDRLMSLYKKAWYECDRGYVDPRKFPDLDSALYQFACENHCTYDEAFILAKTGKKMF